MGASLKPPHPGGTKMQAIITYHAEYIPFNAFSPALPAAMPHSKRAMSYVIGM